MKLASISAREEKLALKEVHWKTKKMPVTVKYKKKERLFFTVKRVLITVKDESNESGRTTW